MISFNSINRREEKREREVEGREEKNAEKEPIIIDKIFSLNKQEDNFILYIRSI